MKYISKTIYFIHRGGNVKSDFLGSSITKDEFLFDYQGNSTLLMLLSAFRASRDLPPADIYIVEGGLGFWVAYFKKLFLKKAHIVVMAVDPLFNWRGRSHIKNVVLKHAFRSIDYVLPISTFVAKDIYTYTETIPYSIVHHYVDIEQFSSIRTDYSKKNLLFMIHRPKETAETKGLNSALQIFQSLYEKDPQWHLYIIGQDTKELTISHPHVHLEGNQEPARYFKICPILIVPARYEAFSLAAVEACIAGVFPIISDMCGAQEFLKPTKLENFVEEILHYDALPTEQKRQIADTLQKSGSRFTKEASIREMKQAMKRINTL